MKNKILLFSFIFILFSFCFINSVFAVTTDVPESFLNLMYNTEDYKTGNYFLMVTKNDITKYKVYFIPKIDNLKVYCDGSTLYFNPTVSGVKVYKAGDTGLGDIIGTYNFSKEQYMHNSSNLFFAEFDVYTDNTYSNFFFKAPVVEIPATPVIPTPVTLAGIMNKAGEQATAEVGQIILTVMKVTAGLIACVIGFKAGWKFFRDGWWC